VEIGPSMDTALYYTLSTIAQTLAGALAVLVAVVVFRLAALDKTLDAGRDVLRGLPGIPYEETWPVLRDRGYPALEALLASPPFNVHIGSTGGRECANAHDAYKTWGRITWRLAAALVATAITIALCFVALPYTPSVASSGNACRVLIPAVALGIICLGLYGWLIAAMVRRPE